jgi:hypothetical protein
LKSICIPASVELLRPGEDFRLGSFSLESITFAPGSRLHTIDEYTFQQMPLLKSICLPASVEHVSGSAFDCSRLENLEVEQGNPFFCVRNSFLISLKSPRTTVFYFGKESELTIDDDIEEIGDSCFCDRHSLLSVRFG